MVIAGDVLLALVVLYLVLGAGYAVRFSVHVAGRVNARAKFASPFFRAALVPGAMLLWPWLFSLERSGRIAAGLDDEAEIS